MAGNSQEKRAELLGELAREFRQFNGLGASFFRAAAARKKDAPSPLNCLNSRASSPSNSARFS